MVTEFCGLMKGAFLVLLLPCLVTPTLTHSQSCKTSVATVAKYFPRRQAYNSILVIHHVAKQ